MHLLTRRLRTKGKSRPPQRVLVVGTGTLLDDSLSKLLETGAQVCAICLDYTDETAVLEAVASFQPDTLVLTDAEPLLLDPTLNMDKLLPNLPALRIVVIRLNSNLIDLYQKQQIVVTNHRDLFKALQIDDQ